MRGVTFFFDFALKSSLRLLAETQGKWKEMVLLFRHQQIRLCCVGNRMNKWFAFTGGNAGCYSLTAVNDKYVLII